MWVYVCVCILFVSPWWDGPSVGCHGDALRAGPVEVVLAVDSERVRVCVDRSSGLYKSSDMLQAVCFKRI